MLMIRWIRGEPASSCSSRGKTHGVGLRANEKDKFSVGFTTINQQRKPYDASGEQDTISGMHEPRLHITDVCSAEAS